MASSLFIFWDSSNFLVLPMGVEPTTAILETAALPLSYGSIVQDGGRVLVSDEFANVTGTQVGIVAGASPATRTNLEC